MSNMRALLNFERKSIQLDPLPNVPLIRDLVTNTLSRKGKILMGFFVIGFGEALIKRRRADRLRLKRVPF